MREIRVVLADDHNLVRQGIRQFLDQAPDIQVLAEAEDGAQAVELVASHQPDVAILDIRMPHVGGVEATRQIRARFPQVRILILTAHDDEPYIMALLRAGATGYILKTASSEELLHAVRSVFQGESTLSPKIAEKVIRQTITGRPANAVDQVEALTGRETEVLELAAEGATNREIGQKLGISHRTVQGHLASIYGKLEVNSRTEAVTEGIRQGWIVVR